MMKKLLLMILALMLLCGGAALAEEKISVVCTDFPCYDFARAAAGDRAEVTMLIKPGLEAHLYDPAPADILEIEDADLFIYIGGESDAWVENILSSFGEGGPRALRLMDAVDELIEEEEEEAGHVHEDEGPEYDEHIWTSPKNAMAMVSAVGEALGAADPGHAADYAALAADYARKIGDIDGRIAEIVGSAARRVLVFADRFPFVYFVREFGLDYDAAFPSCTAQTEASPQTILRLIDRVLDEDIPAVYTIEMSAQSVAKIVAEETGAEILTLHSMQTVTQDEFEAGETYLTLMEKNIEALQRGLQ